MKRLALLIAGALVLLSAALTLGLSSAQGAGPALWSNCTHVHAKHPHGVGKLRAHDSTSGTPVTTFRRSTRLYNVAMSYNRGLDRDKDGVVCEKQ